MLHYRGVRSLILAIGFLTRVPMPSLPNFKQEELATSAIWFPWVGACIGWLLLGVFSGMGWLAATAMIAPYPMLTALLALLCWVLITGGLHLDGAADLADALGAAHRTPARLLEVMKDPHTGSFGVIAIVLIILTKFAALYALTASFSASSAAVGALVLIPAWARFGALWWSHTLPALAAGHGEQFVWAMRTPMLVVWGVVLFLSTIWLVSWPFGLAAVLVLLLWRSYLQWRLGGMSGDCLGAGIEYSECILLVLAVWVG